MYPSIPSVDTQTTQAPSTKPSLTVHPALTFAPVQPCPGPPHTRPPCERGTAVYMTARGQQADGLLLTSPGGRGAPPRATGTPQPTHQSAARGVERQAGKMVGGSGGGMGADGRESRGGGTSPRHRTPQPTHRPAGRQEGWWGWERSGGKRDQRGGHLPTPPQHLLQQTQEGGGRHGVTEVTGRQRRASNKGMRNV